MRREHGGAPLWTSATGRRGVHGEVFGSIRPESTVMQVSRFIDPAWLEEVEVDAMFSTTSS